MSGEWDKRPGEVLEALEKAMTTKPEPLAEAEEREWRTRNDDPEGFPWSCEEVDRLFATLDATRAALTEMRSNFILIANAAGNLDPTTAHHAVHRLKFDHDQAIMNVETLREAKLAVEARLTAATERVAELERERDEALQIGEVSSRALAQLLDLAIGPGKATATVEDLKGIIVERDAAQRERDALRLLLARYFAALDELFDGPPEMWRDWFERHKSLYDEEARAALASPSENGGEGG